MDRQSFRYAAVLAAVCLLWSTGSPVQAAKVQVPAGQEVKVSFDPSLVVSSGSLVTGVPVLIRLAEPITVAGEVIVEAGARGTASVKESVRAGRGGKPGKLVIEFIDLEPKGKWKPIGADRIRIEGSVERTGKGRKLLSYLFIFGLFIKGTQAELPADSVYVARLAENVLFTDE